MSAAAKSWVRRSKPTDVFPARKRASRYAVLVELAWRAGDGPGHSVARSHAQIVDETQIPERTVKRALGDLEEAQMIVRHRGGRDHCETCAGARAGVVVYDVVIPESVEDVHPDQLDLFKQAQMAPGHTSGLGHGGPGTGATVTPLLDVKTVSSSLDQVGEFSETPELPPVDADVLQPVAREGGSAGARGVARPKPVTYRGKTVPRAIVADAEQLLDVFNESAESRIGARSMDGKASPALKQIVGAMIDRPDEPAEVWERGVRAMLAEPPDWIEGRFTVGHLFGPRAAEHTLARGRTGGAVAGQRRGGGMSASDWGAIADHLEAQGAAA